MLEIEVKYRLPDRDGLVARLLAAGATRGAERAEADHYFNAPDRDFRRTDEAFRLRRIGPRNVLTYKGPKRAAATKTREEIEVPLADGDAAADVLETLLVKLGYRPVAVVRKTRQGYKLDRDGFAVEACIDDVENVGLFAELEIVAPEADFGRAEAVVLGLAGELGLTDVERRSYLGMLLAVPPG